MKIGGHVSVAGGLHNAIAKAVGEEFEALQIFVSAPQSFRITNYTEEQIDNFVTLFKEHKFHSLFFHAIYLLNLVSDNKRLVDLSVESLQHYLRMGQRLGSVGTIVHLGSYKSGSFEGVKKQLIETISFVTQDAPEGQFLIVENSAAGGGKIPANLDEMEFIWQNSDQNKIRFCLDTQHLFAAGIDTSDYSIFEDFLHQFDEKIGMSNVVCIHANDSKSELGSGHDRHENIGEGVIGESGFKNILSQSLLQDIPYILETPGANKSGPNKENKDRLLQLALG